MTFNSDINHNTSAEVNTQISSYFDIVDNSIAMSDTNKKYVIDAQASYSPSAPIHAGSFTTFIISPTSDNTADLYNGFIKATFKIHFRINKAISDLSSVMKKYKLNTIWVGFKDSMDAVEKYEILSNGVSIYTQNNGPEESFLTACGANETAKRADVYSKVRHKDIFNRKFDLARCGEFVEIDTTTDLNEIEIPIKIDLRRFLPLSNIKYLPAFAGKFELKIMFSTIGLVWCPVGIPTELKNNIPDLTKLVIPDITNEFTQIGDSAVMWVSSSTAESSGITTLTADSRTVYVDRDYEINNTYTIIPNFGIDNDIYSRLVQRYTNSDTPLIFPTQTLQFHSLSKQLTNKGPFTSMVNITPRFIDSIFFLFPYKTSHHTIFKNPLFNNFQLRCGSYGAIPSIPIRTAGKDPAFIEICQNAMNVNADQTGFNKEVINSLCNTYDMTKSTGLTSNDRTSFFIGLPTETDNTFQQGQTSNTPINYEIIGDIASDSTYGKSNQTPPLIAVLNDTIIAISVQPNGMPPIVQLSILDITSRQMTS